MATKVEKVYVYIDTSNVMKFLIDGKSTTPYESYKSQTSNTSDTEDGTSSFDGNYVLENVNIQQNGKNLYYSVNTCYTDAKYDTVNKVNYFSMQVIGRQSSSAANLFGDGNDLYIYFYPAYNNTKKAFVEVKKGNDAKKVVVISKRALETYINAKGKDVYNFNDSSYLGQVYEETTGTIFDLSSTNYQTYANNNTNLKYIYENLVIMGACGIFINALRDKKDRDYKEIAASSNLMIVSYLEKLKYE